MLIDEPLKTLFIYILHLFIFMAIKKNKVLFFLVYASIHL